MRERERVFITLDAHCFFPSMQIIYQSFASLFVHSSLIKPQSIHYLRPSVGFELLALGQFCRVETFANTGASVCVGAWGNETSEERKHVVAPC
jgi:hypothetical protein